LNAEIFGKKQRMGAMVVYEMGEIVFYLSSLKISSFWKIYEGAKVCYKKLNNEEGRV